MRHALGSLTARLGGMGEERDVIARRAERLRVALDACLGADHDQLVVWSERGAAGPELRSAPVSVAPLLREHLWGRLHAAVLTSATLSIEGDLSHTRARLGLAGADELVLASPFDVAVAGAALPPARRRPIPRSAGWDQAIADHIAAIVRASDGRALCLFTSWRALEAVRGLVAAELGAYTLLVQGEAPRERLLEAFRADVHSVLLATQSFWQGVDIRGEACSCVIIDRLPFAVPSDPLVAGRCEQIVRDGGSAFDDYALPQAALMLRQGFGRLLRSHDDRGVVAVLDGRLNTARYARAAARGARAGAARARDRGGRGLLRAVGRARNDDLCWASVSKRKQEATRRNAERKAAAGRRTPPGYKPSSRRPTSFGGRRVLGGAGALLRRRACSASSSSPTNVFGSDKLAGMKTLVKNGTCVETDFKKSMGRAHTTDPKTKVIYTQSDPPTSGKHYQSPPPLMIYDEPVPQWILLHALEHGNVLVQYGDKVSAADRAALRAAVLQPPQPHADGAVPEARQARRLHRLAAHAQLPGLPGGRAHGRAGQVERHERHRARSARRSTRRTPACCPAPAGRRRCGSRLEPPPLERREREAQQRGLLGQRRIRHDLHADVAAVDAGSGCATRRGPRAARARGPRRSPRRARGARSRAPRARAARAWTRTARSRRRGRGRAGARRGGRASGGPARRPRARRRRRCRAPR